MTSFNGDPTCEHSWVQDNTGGMADAGTTSARCSRCGLREETQLFGGYGEERKEPVCFCPNGEPLPHAAHYAPR